MKKKISKIFLYFLVFGIIFSAIPNVNSDSTYLSNENTDINKLQNDLRKLDKEIKDLQNNIDILEKDRNNIIYNKKEIDGLDKKEKEDEKIKIIIDNIKIIIDNYNINNDDIYSKLGLINLDYYEETQFLYTPEDSSLIYDLRDKIEEVDSKNELDDCNYYCEQELKILEDEIVLITKKIKTITLEDYTKLNDNQKEILRKNDIIDIKELFEKKQEQIEKEYKDEFSKIYKEGKCSGPTNECYTELKRIALEKNQELTKALNVATGLQVCGYSENSECSDMGIKEIRCDKLDDECISKIFEFYKSGDKTNSENIKQITLMEQQFNLNFFGSLISYIGSRDENAIKVLKLFGIDDNLENVPIFLREPFPSYICLSKIKGYLDAEDTDSQGGVTKYGCDKSNGDNGLTNDYQDPRCNLIIADIRGSRTPLTPDGKIAITYSSYLKAPTEDDVKYATIITYKQNEKIEYFIVNNFTTVKKNEDVKKYQNLLLPINIDLGKIDENSFQISQVAVFTDGNRATRNIYSKITANIILITTSDYYNTLSSVPSKVSEYTGNNNNLNILDLLNLN